MTLDQNQTTRHLRELQAIKWLLAIIAVSLLVMSIAIVIWVRFFIKTYQPCKEVRPVVQVQPCCPERVPYGPIWLPYSTIQRPCSPCSPVWQPYSPVWKPYTTVQQPYVIEEQPLEEIEKQPYDFPAKASELLDQEKYSELISLAEEQRNVNPDDPYAYHYLGMAYYRTKEFKNAAEYLQKADELSPNDPYRSYYLGMAYYHVKEFEKAIEHLMKAQELSPSWKEKYTGPYIKAAKEALDSQGISPQETP
jgi:tetratricopeptide (TPR) repeat protein